MLRKMFSVIPVILTVILSTLHMTVFPVNAENETDILQFTSDEKDYIASHPVLKIGYVTDRIPVCFSDKDGELAGISQYIFDHIGELCGIKFQYVPLPSGDVTYDYLLNEGFDLVSSVEYNKENQNARGILISDPYLSGRKVVVARDEFEFDPDAHLTVAISTGSQTIRKVMNASYPNFKLVDYPSITACFDAVNSGEADMLMQNQYVAEHWIAKPIYEKLKVIPVLGLDDQLCFSAVVAFGDFSGPSAEDGRTLINILNKAIATITDEDIGAYTIRAISENQYKFTISDFLYKYRYPVTALIFSFIIILLLIILLTRLYVRFAANKADEKAKDRFLSTMSHEIRTPLNGLIGLNYLMSQKLDDRKNLENYLNQSTVTANYLLSLINDILDMSKLQTRDMKLNLDPIDLSLLLDTVNSIIKQSMSDKELQYNVDCQFIQPCIMGDTVRIQQILLNLLDNALKFTDKGGVVSLSLKQEPADDDKILTTVTVSDTGRGMSNELQDRIFDTFTQDPGTVSKGNHGAGLGLSISRNLAQLMGGDLTFVSRLGTGSTFTFSFTSSPVRQVEDDTTSAVEPEQKLPRIMIAEDNELNAEIITELLHENGYATALAVNGKEALKMFSASRTGTYGIILMDLRMPELDGFDTAEAIRSLDRPDAKTVRIIACTANSSAEDKEKAAAVGMNDFISKPINLPELLKKING